MLVTHDSPEPAGAGALLTLLGLLVGPVRRVRNARRAARRRRHAAPGDEMRARAMMSELCPHGWRAEITLFAGAEEQLPIGRDGRRHAVALDWAELEGWSRQPAVTRRVVATTLSEALEAMITDRRTDETLERIEQHASADGVLWPDL